MPQIRKQNVTVSLSAQTIQSANHCGQETALAEPQGRQKMVAGLWVIILLMGSTARSQTTDTSMLTLRNMPLHDPVDAGQRDGQAVLPLHVQRPCQ